MQRLIALTVLLVALLLLGSPIANRVAAEESSSTAETKSEDAETPKSASKPTENGEDEKKDAEDEPSEDEAESDEDAETDEKTEKSEKTKKPEKKKPKPYKVKAEKLKVEVELKGVFVADEMEEVALRPEVWTRFKVVDAVEHGATVKKGDVLVRFDDERLEDDLADEALSQSVGQLDLLQAEEELPRVQRLQELAFEEAERRRDQTKHDYDYYHKVDRPFAVEIAHFRYKSAQEELASAQEELDQLQQMYEADELTEETEEIVLRRQRFAVETAELILKINEENRDYTLNVSLPRSDQYYETALEESELTYQQAKTALETGKTRRSYDMEKKRKARADSIERHGKLLSDKGLMELRAPCDGVVYYGKCTNGKWSQITSLSAKLRPFGTATPNSVLMTIVKPGALHVESTLTEKQVPDVKADQPTTIVPTADPELKLKGKIAEVDAIPSAGNKFQVQLEFDQNNVPDWLAAGMTCEANVVVYENKEAVVVPLALVQTDEDDEDEKYVMLVDDDEDEPVRRTVKLGRKQGKNVEVLKGLEAGDQIVKEEKKEDEED